METGSPVSLPRQGLAVIYYCMYSMYISVFASNDASELAIEITFDWENFGSNLFRRRAAADWSFLIVIGGSQGWP